MKLLAIDSSGMTASAALFSGEILLAEYTVNYAPADTQRGMASLAADGFRPTKQKKTHSQTLLPMIDEIVKMTQTELSELEAIAVAAGPGSFTGLRIGSATAKGLGLALNKPLISVPTLEGLAYNLFGSEALVCPMMDARRKQVYTGIYRFCGKEFQVVSAQEACPVEKLIEKCNALGEKVMFLGDGVPVYRKILEELLTVPHGYAPAHLNRQRAGAVGIRAMQLYREGKTETAAQHAPIYLRKSQAERELEAKGKKLEE